MRGIYRTRLSFLIAAAALFGACAEDGETPDCPPLRLYDISNAQSVAAARAEMKAAAAKGCITLPAGFDSDGGSAGADSGP